jgi:tetratricopeptide (TPR) repeat protein
MRRILAVLGLLPLLLAVHAGAQQTPPSGAIKGRELLAAGRYEAALPYFQRDLDEAEASHGSGDPSIAGPLNDLAEANRLAGRYETAEALYRRALDLDEKAASKNAEGVATTLNNLALVNRQQGRVEEAERLHLRSLNLLQDSVGPNDPRVAMSLHNLAALYRQKGRLAEARPLQERAVAVADKSLGRQHPDTRKFRATLAALGKAPESGVASTSAPVKRERLPQPAPGKGALPPPPLHDEPEFSAPAVRAGFVVLVAAVPKAEQVPGEWQRLLKRYPDLRSLELQPVQSVEVKGKGTFYRVIAGPLASKAEADALCARLRRAGASCRPASS